MKPRLEREREFTISKHADQDDIDSAKHWLERAFADACRSESPVIFEIWKPATQPEVGQLHLPFLPAEAALEQ